MDLFLIRHAQPAWIDENGGGVNDPGLTALGRAQAALVAEERARFGGVDAVWVSPTVRTRQTAAPLLEALAHTPAIEDGFHEIRTPDWQGRSAEDVARTFEQAAARSPDEWWQGMPGGEPFHAFSARVREALLARLAEMGASPRGETGLWDVQGRRRVVLVGHGGTNAVVLEALLGVPPVPWPWERFATAHASITRVQSKRIAGGAIWALRSYNTVEHLPPEHRSR